MQMMMGVPGIVYLYEPNSTGTRLFDFSGILTMQANAIKNSKIYQTKKIHYKTVISHSLAHLIAHKPIFVCITL